MDNLTEYSNNYSDTCGSLWQFKRDESPVTYVKNPDNVAVDNSTSFKYKSSISGEPANDGILRNAKIVCSSSYLIS